jgi:hypothetical protein
VGRNPAACLDVNVDGPQQQQCGVRSGPKSSPQMVEISTSHTRKQIEQATAQDIIMARFMGRVDSRREGRKDQRALQGALERLRRLACEAESQSRLGLGMAGAIYDVRYIDYRKFSVNSRGRAWLTNCEE